MRWQDLVNISVDEFNRMNKSELKAATQILASAGNKRIKRMQEAGKVSSSAEYVLKKGKFSTAGKTFQQLKNEFMRAKQFMESKTGSLAAMTKLEKKSISALSEAGVSGVTSENYGQFWRAYEELKRADPQVANAGMKYLVLQEIADKQREGLSFDEVVAEVRGNLDDIYARSQGWVEDFNNDNPWESDADIWEEDW